MLGIAGLVEIGEVTRNACSGSTRVTGAAGVAGPALDRHVGSGKRESGAVVVKRGGCPLAVAVAGSAIQTESCGRVIRIDGSVEIGDVARRAGSGGARIVAAGVALLACNRRVRPGEGKSGAVIEFDGSPAVHLMAVCA